MTDPMKNPRKKMPFMVKLLVLAGILAGGYYGYRALTPDTIRGELLDAALVTLQDGSQRLWILCDDSFNYTQSTSSGGGQSMSSECLSCTTVIYVYDPASKKVVKRIEQERDDIAIHVNIIHHSGRMWIIQGGFGDDVPRIEVYDAATAELVTDTAAFVAQHPLLKAGLVTVMYDKDDDLLTLKTKDGREGLLFDMDNDRFYDDHTALALERRKMTGAASLCVLAPENHSGPRRRLYGITGPARSLAGNMSSLDMWADNPNMLRMGYGATSRSLNETIYLEGIIYHQDKESVIIIHLDQVGKQANRILSCVDLESGKGKWTVGKETLFDEMRIDEEDDSFSGLFFTRDHIKVLRSGDLVTVSMKGVGIMGFDFATGKQRWRIDI